MRRRFVTLSACLTVLYLPHPANADVVTDWNSTAITISRAAADPVAQRTLTLVHLAIFDAVNSVDPRYHAFGVQLDGAGASPEAAAAAAAYGILVRRFPAQKAALDTALAASLAAVPDGPGEDAGTALGDAVAAALYQLRSGDGMTAPVNPPYVAGTGPGAYQLTGPTVANTGAFSWQPFSLDSASQFRPNGPPALHSTTYARDLEEVRVLGTSATAGRTPTQDLIARWHTEQAQLQLNRVARGAVAAGVFDLLDSARMFAMLNMALMDGTIAVFEAKYHFNFWRPVTAIRSADTDGNDATGGDATWSPFLPVPPHPEYPAAHAAIGAAGVTVLEKFLGNHYAFSLGEEVALIPGTEVREFVDLQALLEDMEIARIYGGMHFRTSLEEGERQGKKIGKWVLEHALLPLEH